MIYGAGKTAEQIIGISKSFAEHGQKDILITRLDKAKAEKINKEIPLDYYDMANIGRLYAERTCRENCYRNRQDK